MGIVGFLTVMTMASATNKLLCGEWVIRHSNSPAMPFMNRVVVHIYPQNEISVSHRFSSGPCVFRREKMGTYSFRGGGEELLEISLINRPDRLLSVLGVGVEFLGVQGKADERDRTFTLGIDLNTGEDLFLSSPRISFHLVRSVRVDEPSIDVPFGTLVSTQILGSLLAHLLVRVGEHIHLPQI